MTDETLLTLRQLAEQLSLPESTVRYYRDAFLDHIPSVGIGRRRRYPPLAADVLRVIASSYAAGQSRAEIVAAFHADGRTPVTMRAGKAHARSVDDVSNLDLLAAILDGEREQRDALWQMAKEIVRLTGILEGQDAVLTEIADRAGVAVEGRALPGGSRAALSAPAAAAEPPAVPAASVPSSRSSPSSPSFLSFPSPSGDMDRLRAELEAERELVERLREAKKQLEHRATDAEAELEETRRRPSVLRRLFGGDGA